MLGGVTQPEGTMMSNEEPPLIHILAVDCATRVPQLLLFCLSSLL